VTVKPGDWIRFMSNGKLVISEVAYVVICEWDDTKMAVTVDNGDVSVKDILEHRERAK